MRSRLPPLNSLRAFDAAARHLSFTRAAEELHVTQAAVSHQIRSLEDYLGVSLFTRLSRSLELTPEGVRYHPGVRVGFESLERATDELQHTDSRGRLTVSVMPSFAARWLVPRMGRFQAKHPEIDLLISPSRDLVDFNREPVDVAIRYTRNSTADHHSVKLMTDEIYPVCAPGLIDGTPPLRQPSDLANHTLLHDETDYDWQKWLELAGVEGVDSSRGPVFIDASMLIQAAVDGLGIALTRKVLVENDLAHGRLVRAFDLTLPSAQEYAYHLVCPEASANKPKVVAFREWLVSEVGLEQSETGNT